MTESAAARLCRARLASLGEAPDARSLAEVIWLAWTLRGTLSDEPRPAEPTPGPPPSPAPASDDPGMAPTPPVPPPAPAPDRGGLFDLYQPKLAPDAAPSLPASFLAVPAGEALPQRRRLERALKPFKRPLPSSRRQRLDATATAEASADSRAITPVFVAAPERWFDVALLVEESDSMQVWAQTVDDLQRLMAGHGAFRRVTLWRYAVRSGQLRLFTSRGVAALPRVVVDPQGRRLCLFLTHGTSPEWRRAPLVDFVRRLGRSGPVAIMQMMPHRAWPHTALGDALDELQARVPGEPNLRLRRRHPFLDTFEREAEASTVPVLTLEAEPLRAWAGFVMATRGSTHPAVKLEVFLNDEPLAASTGTPIWPRDRVTMFRTLASPQAYQLMRLLAGLPLTLPIMRLMQRGMPGERSQVHLAEVLLSGLLRRTTPPDADVPPDQVEYEFLGGVREELLGSLSVAETESVDALSRQIREGAQRFVEAHLGRAMQTTSALFRDAAGTERMLASAHSFLTVSSAIDALRRAPVESPATSVKAGIEATNGSASPAPAAAFEFLSQDAIAAAVRREAAALSLPDLGPLRCLLLLSTATQQTWLVGSALSLAFVLDDAATRRSDSAVQRLDGWLDALPVTPSIGSRGQSVVALGPPEKPPWFYSTSLFASRELLRSHVHKLMPQASAKALRTLRELALQYEGVRRDQPPGPRRTQAMTNLANRMRPQTHNIDLSWRLLARSDSEGNRLVGVMALRARFDVEQTEWLAGLVRESSAFVAFHAALALREAMPALSLDERQRVGLATAAARQDLLSRGLRDAGVHAVLEAIDLEVDLDRQSWAEDASGTEQPLVTSAASEVVPPRSGYRVFVSMPFAQREERRCVADELKRLGHAILQEEPQTSFPSALAQIEQCDAFLCLIGLRYSAWMEREYEEAARLRKPMLVFMQERTSVHVQDLGEARNADLARFSRLLLARQVVHRYRTVADLAHRLGPVFERLDEWVAARDRLTPVGAAPTPFKVLVAGTGRGEEHLSDKVLQTCVRLGVGLARAGYGLVTGGWPGVDELTARSFDRELARLGIALDERLTQFLPIGEAPAFPGGRLVATKAGRANTAAAVEDSSFVVLVGGEGGTRAVARAASQHRRPVLPLADTGGDAAGVHDELSRRTSAAGTPRASLDAAELDRLTGPAPQVVDDVLLILDRLAKETVRAG